MTGTPSPRLARHGVARRVPARRQRRLHLAPGDATAGAVPAGVVRRRRCPSHRSPLFFIILFFLAFLIESALVSSSTGGLPAALLWRVKALVMIAVALVVHAFNVGVVDVVKAMASFRRRQNRADRLLADGPDPRRQQRQRLDHRRPRLPAPVTPGRQRRAAEGRAWIAIRRTEGGGRADRDPCRTSAGDRRKPCRSPG